MLGGTPRNARSLSFVRVGFAALLVAGACQSSKFGSTSEPRGGAGGGATGGKGGKGGAPAGSAGGRGGSAGRTATGGSDTGGTGGDAPNGGAPEGGEGNETATGGSTSAGRGGVAGDASSAGTSARGGASNGGGASTSGGPGSAGSGASGCPAEAPLPMEACPEERLDALCYYDDGFFCNCDLRPELNSEPTWYCLGCPEDPVQSYDPCAPVSASCTYGEMTCECTADGDAGSWRCLGCPPELPTSGSCFPDGWPANDCTYGNAVCGCDLGNGFHCTGGCEPGWFSFTDVSPSDHTHPAWSTEELRALIDKINLGNNFTYSVPISTDATSEHGHEVPFNAANLWILQSGLGEVTIRTGLGDGHEWLVECMP